MFSDLSIATFNAENFYLLLDRNYSFEEFHCLTDDDLATMNQSIYIPNKTLDKVAKIAQTIRSRNFDILGLVEVGGMETLQNLNRYFLDNAYECIIYEENSKRGIYVGALIKKGRFHSIRHRSVPGKFSRNVLEIKLGLGPKTIVFYVIHLKSHFGQENGIEVRAKEVAQLCRIIPHHNCIIMGDFNGLAIPGLAQFEFEPLLELPFRDVLEAQGIHPLQRVTHYYFDPQPRFNQLDYIFCSNDIQILEAGTITEYIPNTKEERDWLPSDHCFLTARIRPKRR